MESTAYSTLVADGKSLFERRQSDAAAVLFRQAIRLGPDDACAHNWLGLAELAAGELSAAEAAFNRALQLAPTEPLYHVNYGTALKERGLWAAAIAAYELLRVRKVLSPCEANFGRKTRLLCGQNFSDSL